MHPRDTPREVAIRFAILRYASRCIDSLHAVSRSFPIFRCTGQRRRTSGRRRWDPLRARRRAGPTADPVAPRSEKGGANGRSGVKRRTQSMIASLRSVRRSCRRSGRRGGRSSCRRASRASRPAACNCWDLDKPRRHIMGVPGTHDTTHGTTTGAEREKAFMGRVDGVAAWGRAAGEGSPRVGCAAATG